MTSSAKTADEIRQDKAMSISLGEAIKWGVAAGLVAGAGTLAAHLKSPNFRKMTSVSVKTAIPVMSFLFFFSLRYEHMATNTTQHPERYGLVESVPAEIRKKTAVMPFHHKVMNYMYDHPFVVLASLGIPFAGKILHSQLPLKHLKLSQRIMHTRVFAQAGVLAILLSTMAFRGYMEKRGKFPEPGEEGEDENEMLTYKS